MTAVAAAMTATTAAVAAVAAAAAAAAAAVLHRRVLIAAVAGYALTKKREKTDRKRNEVSKIVSTRSETFCLCLSDQRSFLKACQQ